MKIIFLNTYNTFGGAAIACKRLQKSLLKNNINASIIVNDNYSSISVLYKWIKKINNLFNFSWERFIIWINNGFSRKNLFTVSIANTGSIDLSLIKQADIIHLHWINHGFISLKNLNEIISTGKPVVWTMHDMWACTGICHHARNCQNYADTCGNCQFLYNGKKEKDLSFNVFLKKKFIYEHSDIYFVTCSNWLRDCCKKSALIKNKNITVIPNPIDTNIFKSMDKKMARQHFSLEENKKYILFGSVKITDKRKGFDYIIEACDILSKNKDTSKIEVILFGQYSKEIAKKIPLKVHPLNYISDIASLVKLYNSVDLFVTPSLEENLPNMIMESMACGTPCVGFNIGGIPEMIDHKKNGYIAEYKNSNDLANGIHWILKESNINELSYNARKKVVETYSEDIVAKQYIDLYKSIVKQ